MRKSKTLPAIAVLPTVIFGLLSVGCQCPAQRPQPKPVTTVLPPAEAVQKSCLVPTAAPVVVSKEMPAEVTVGETFEYKINYKANGCVANVVISDQLPSGATFVKSDPPAELKGDRLIWMLGDLDPDQSGTIRVWLKAEQEGKLLTCATVSADPRTCAFTLVGKPVLTVEKSGPETAILGNMVQYTIVVANRGSAVLRDVVLTDTLPAGLVSPDGRQQLAFQVGNLAPNESRTFSVNVKATQRGRQCNVVEAKASNAEPAKAEFCTTVLQPGLNIRKSGDTERFIGRTASYQIVVSNTGDTPLTNVLITDTIPQPAKVVSASRNGTVSGNQVIWQLAQLDPGQEVTLELTLTCNTPGNFCNNVTVTTAEGLQDSAQACTLWRGVGAVLIEVVDDPDPIMVGELTTYTIQVTNQGTADLHNLKIVAEFDKEMQPVSSPEGTVSGQQVIFPAVPTLGPKQSFTYTIKAKGVTPGDARNRVILTVQEMERPVVEEESTHVY